MHGKVLLGANENAGYNSPGKLSSFEEGQNEKDFTSLCMYVVVGKDLDGGDQNKWRRPRMPRKTLMMMLNHM